MVSMEDNTSMILFLKLFSISIVALKRLHYLFAPVAMP